VGIGSQNVSTPEARRSTMFLASELMEGGTLKALVMKEMLGAGVSGSLYTLRDAVQWCCQIAEGLAYLHSVQPIVVHRDLKLDNVLLTAAQAFKNGGQPDRSSQIAKLADFGLVAFVKKQTLGAVIDKCTFSMKYQGDDSPFDHEAVQERSKIMISAMSKGGKEKVEYFASMKGDASVKGGAAFSPTDIQVKGLLTGQTGTLMYMAPGT
jgi:serine/threonine protein kinase